MGQRLSRFVGVGVCLLFFGAGCVRVPEFSSLTIPQGATSSNGVVSGSIMSWSVEDAGIERAKVRFSTSTASEVVIYRFSIVDHRFAFRHSTSTAAVSEWLTRIPEALFVSNGVYFHEDGLPSGWLRTKGEAVGTRLFDVDKSAVLELQPRVGIRISATEQGKLKQEAKEAAQSFPLLVSHGRALVKEDSGKVARRTFVGIDRAHAYLYVGIVPYTGISLYELSQALVSLPVQWESVLNLDGGPSSGFAFRAQKRSETIDSYVTVPNVLVVLSKE